MLNQLNEKNGKLIYIKKLNTDIAKAYKITLNNKSYINEYLFDVFSNFSIDKKNSEFKFWWNII